MFHPMKVHEIMTPQVRSVGTDNTLVEAAGVMRSLDVGAVPVCEDGRVVGMLTDRDIAIRAIAKGCDPNRTTVREAMTDGAFCVFAEDDVEDAARLMRERQIRRVPVVNREDRLVGVVSLGDVSVSSNPAFGGQTLRDVSEDHRGS